MERYFRRRALSAAPDYEEGYWGVVVDPDGNRRDRAQEREKHLEDVKQELEFLNALAGGRIVDVGCGLGYLLSGLDSLWERHGVEVSGFAAERAQQWGKIVNGTLQNAGYASDSFEAVVLHHVIEHVVDPVDLIREIRRILKPMGVLVLGTPDFDSACARRFGEKYRLLHDKTHISLFTNDSMHRFLRDHGFVIERVEYPYFETRYFTVENLGRLFDTDAVSPPFYGNFMTFYCRKPLRSSMADALARLSRTVQLVSDSHRTEIERIREWLRSAGGVVVSGSGMDADLTERTNAMLRKRQFSGPDTVAVQFQSVSSAQPSALRFSRTCDTSDAVTLRVEATPGEEQTTSILLFEAVAAFAASAAE